MLILSTDTSGKQGSIALAKAASADSRQLEVLEVVSLEGGNFSAQMVPQIGALLGRHGFRKSDIGGFVVASGPGSFTGLRVGLAAIKGLAEVLAKPIATMSLLEALALASAKPGRTVTAIDAGRGEIYSGEYEVEGELAKLLREELLSKEEFFAKARSMTVITSDEKIAADARAAGVAVSIVPAIDAGAIARLGWRKLRAGETVSPELLEANYIRRTDAEILAKVSS